MRAAARTAPTPIWVASNPRVPAPEQLHLMLVQGLSRGDVRARGARRARRPCCGFEQWLSEELTGFDITIVAYL